MVGTSQSALDGMCKIESQTTGTVCVSVCVFLELHVRNNYKLWITHVNTLTGLHETNPHVPLVFKVPRS